MADFSKYTHKFRANGDAYASSGVRKTAKRNRQPVSCTPCRTRKLKCDRQQPCEACVKRGDEDTCHYRTSTVKGTPWASVQGDDRHAAQDRLQRLEELVMQMMSKGENAGSALSGPGSSATMTIPEEPRPTANEGHLLVEGNQSNYVGSTHWSAILDNIHELRSVIVAESVATEDSWEDEELRDPDTLFAASKPPSLERILEQYLPPRVQVDRRLSAYFKAKYLVIPLIHRYQFQRQYEQFWKSPRDMTPLWVSVLFSILCMSATISQATGTELASPTADPSPRELFLTAAAQCLLIGGYTRPRQYVLEALLLFSQCKYMAKLDPSREGSIVFAIMIRLALRMGYHRDPDHFPHLSVFEGEMRRRTWAMCLQFDLMFSFQLGLPSNIQHDLVDTKHPRNLLDSDFDEHTTILPPSRPETDATQILYFVVKDRMMAVFAKVCRQALSPRPVSAGDVMALDVEVRHIYATIPEPLKIRSVAHSFADPSYLIMVRLNCEFLFQKSICVLHRRHMTHGKEYSRKACVDAATSILKHLVDLHKEFKPGGQLYADRWMLSSFTLNDFLLGAMILCLAISTRQRIGQWTPESAEAREQLYLLKQAHAMCLELGTTSREARRVADALTVMLTRLDRRRPPRAPAAQPAGQQLVLTPLSIEDAPLPAASQTPGQLQGLQNTARHAPPATQPIIPGGLVAASPAAVESFGNIFDAFEDADWTLFDQYLVDASGYDETGTD